MGAALVWAAALGVTGCAAEDLSVPAPANDERAATVPILREAYASQGICYGWRLRDDHELVSVGSSLGDGTPAGDAPSCPRWIEVVANVTYPAESSEANDSAWIEVTGSLDIDPTDRRRIERGLGRFGLDADAFVADPGWAITRAATALPLLAAEAGLAQPAATPSAGPAAAESALPAAGNDLWRDRWGWLLATAGLLLLGALFVTVGVVQRRRQLQAPLPAQRAGAGAAERTGEKA